MILSKDERIVLKFLKENSQESPSDIQMRLIFELGISQYNGHVELIYTMIQKNLILRVTNDPIQYAITRNGRQELSDFITQKRKETIGWWMRLILPFTAIALSIFGLIFNYD